MVSSSKQGSGRVEFGIAAPQIHRDLLLLRLMSGEIAV